MKTFNTKPARRLANVGVDPPMSTSLTNGSRVGIIGAGPAGSFFAFFMLKMAESVGLELSVDLYEPRLFAHHGPAGCNHCGGIISESLVQLLATEGIDLPPGVVQRGIESYVLHTDVGVVRIDTPTQEKRIAAVYRCNGPRQSEAMEIAGFDGYLLELARARGANVVRKLVTGFDLQAGRPRIRTADGTTQVYDLVAVAAGVNSQILETVGAAAGQSRQPGMLRAFISEFHLGAQVIADSLGDSMHVFLLDLPRLEFAALIPKGEFVTLCLLGDDVDPPLVEEFLATPEVRKCFPQGLVPTPVCHCLPRINVRAAQRPFADRIVWIGDCGVSRLFKDGIGSAYRTAKSAARTAVFVGVSQADFQHGFWPECRKLIIDNMIARLIFAVTKLIQRLRFVRRGVVRMTAQEQSQTDGARVLSSVLWDVFTGSAPYKEILLRTMHPVFPFRLMWNLAAGNIDRTEKHLFVGRWS